MRAKPLSLYLQNAQQFSRKSLLSIISYIQHCNNYQHLLMRIRMSTHKSISKENNSKNEIDRYIYIYIVEKQKQKQKTMQPRSLILYFSLETVVEFVELQIFVFQI